MAEEALFSPGRRIERKSSSMIELCSHDWNAGEAFFHVAKFVLRL